MTALSSGCEYKANTKGNLKRHRSDVHDIGVTWHECPEPNCSYEAKAKKKNKIKQHIARISVTWHACTELGCDYKAKTNFETAQHKVNKHNIGVNWKQCPDCDYKAKQTDTLKLHIKRHHTSA